MDVDEKDGKRETILSIRKKKKRQIAGGRASLRLVHESHLRCREVKKEEERVECTFFYLLLMVTRDGEGLGIVSQLVPSAPNGSCYAFLFLEERSKVGLT